MDPEPWLADLAAAATEIQASIRGLHCRLGEIQAETAAQVHALDQQMEKVQEQIDDACEQRVRARSWLHWAPTCATWANPVATTADFLRYAMARPQMPTRACEYHKSKQCRVLSNVPDNDIWKIDNLEWLHQRNHIWEPCGICLNADARRRKRIGELLD